MVYLNINKTSLLVTFKRTFAKNTTEKPTLTE